MKDYNNLKYLLGFIAVLGAFAMLVGLIVMIWFEPIFLGGKIALTGFLFMSVFGTLQSIVDDNE